MRRTNYSGKEAVYYGKEFVMKNEKVAKQRILVLGILCMIALTACSTKSDSSKDDKTSSFVVKKIDPVVTSVPVQESEKSVAEKEELYTLSSSIEHSISDNENIEDTEEEKNDSVEQKEAEEVDKIQKFLDDVGSVDQPHRFDKVDEAVVEQVKSMPASSLVQFHDVNSATLAACFYSEEISQETYLRMENKSFNETSTTAIGNLRYVRVLHFGFDDEIYIGELVVNQLIVEDIIEVFKELFDAGYPIERMVLVDDYDADDNLSMAANNTSCFNYRVVDGTTKLSNHAYGLAIDINPLYNPYVRTIEGKEVILPENGTEYADRTLENPYYIKKDDVCYNIFIKHGFTWGGDWETSKDYQHFQKVFQ